MSLLLDALKRAAEQKAKQAEEAENETSLSSDDAAISEDDETLLADTSHPEMGDETYLTEEQTSTQSQVQHRSDSRQDNDDDTKLSTQYESDETVTREPTPYASDRASDDETQLVGGAPDEEGSEDDTLLSQYHDAARDSGDDTKLSTQYESDETVTREPTPYASDRASDDETQLVGGAPDEEASEDDTLMSQYHDAARDSGDDTKLSTQYESDETVTREPTPYASDRPSEDETQLVSGAPDEEDTDYEPAREHVDDNNEDTYLASDIAEDETQVRGPLGMEGVSVDDTNLTAGANEDDTRLLYTGHEEDGTHARAETEEVESDISDDTNLTDSAFRDETKTQPEKSAIEIEDDTDLQSPGGDESVSLLSNDDVSEFLGDPDLLRVRSGSIEQQSADAEERPKTSLFDEEPEDDTLENSINEPPQADSEDISLDTLVRDESTTGSELELVDLTGEMAEQTLTGPGDPTVTIGDATATTGVDLELLKNERTVIRPDTTSTQTYAPDNYDRTLIKPPGEDASRIFAGMRSDEDVLMTPDYAKRVFLSKSSANRIQHYKVYAGIAVSILLAIGIFSLFELQDEYNNIDVALMPLKRDPMPGVLQNTKSGNVANILETKPAPDVDTRTLKIVEGAADTTVTDAGATGTTAIETESTGADQNLAEIKVETTVAKVQTVQPIEKREEKIEIATAAIENRQQPIAQEEGDKPDAPTTKTLKISSSSQFSEKDLWLTQAYQAYQRGDDKTALEKYNQVLDIDPDNRNALLARAAIAIQNGDTVSAIKDYQTLLVANPKDSLAMSSLISTANISPAESESQLKLMIREEPDSPYLNFVLANIYGAQNRWQEAQSLYFQALEHNPDDPNYAYNLAVSLEHIQKPKVAIAYYEKALLNIDRGLATFNKDVVDRRLEVLRRL